MLTQNIYYSSQKVNLTLKLDPGYLAIVGEVIALVLLGAG